MGEWRRKTDSSHAAVSKDYNFDLFKSGICYAVFADKRFFSRTTPLNRACEENEEMSHI
jgi:hypothetical protein